MTRDARPLSEDQIRHSLALGNVVLRYAGSRPPAALRELQDELTGPFDAEIAAAGQAVVLAGGGKTVEALAWGRRLRAPHARATRRCGRSPRRGSARALRSPAAPD